MRCTAFSVERCINQSRLEIVLFKQLSDIPYPFRCTDSQTEERVKSQENHSSDLESVARVARLLCSIITH